MTHERVDNVERDLKIALVQASSKGDEAIKIAQKNLEKYLHSRLSAQLLHKKMESAANIADKLVIQGINSD